MTSAYRVAVVECLGHVTKGLAHTESHRSAGLQSLLVQIAHHSTGTTTSVASPRSQNPMIAAATARAPMPQPTTY